MRDTYVQIADYNQLSAAAALAPIFQYLHDGFNHGTFNQRSAGFKVYSSTGAAGPPAAAGTLLNGANGEVMSFLGVGDVVYTRSLVNSVKNAANQKNLFLARTIITADATAPTMHASADISTEADLFFRKLFTCAAGDEGGWIGAQNAQEIGLQVFCHSGGPVDVHVETTFHEGAPNDAGSTDRPSSVQIVSVASGTGEFIRVQGAVGRIRVGFMGPDPSIVSAGLFIRRGL